MGRRGGAARWGGGEDGEANRGGEVGLRGGAASLGCETNTWSAHARRQRESVCASECACTRARALAGGGARVCARWQSVRMRARAPADASADRIDNNLSIQLWKLVDALVEMQQHW